MSGGVLLPVLRVRSSVVLMLLLLSGCGAFGPPQQAPAPVTEATVLPVETEISPPPPEPVEPDEPADLTPKPAKRPAPKPRAPKPPPPAPTPPAIPAPAPVISIREFEHSVARGLLDSEVQRTNGKVIGRAVDLIADANGKPREMVVNLQGFMGVGDRKVTFPWSAFSFNPAARPKSAPITLRQPGAASVSKGSSPARSNARMAASATQLPLLDSTVQRPDHAAVGRVIDVLIDANAQPQAVVLDVSGIVNPDRRTIAADWNALHFVTSNKVLQPQIDLDETQIKAAPPYLPNQPVRAISPVKAATASAPAAASSSRGVR
ncbi:PRC-barrel domain-containing protein [Paraburkholderia bonniea]|uniref:PRC-barrel domain-containing protein n=1 Tax=Paraburkholderia bonniea TaxID=2152891 RepID=UPI0012911260|nr:PRC-barrel domain-containing protein [Paraburkholderia bonniea]WJF88890.1 PRC-barrel domain-containing protein [Paraburkholderia bonniea]WJF92206.1 PRC-barrel domain-containing protein [Paraburkholderia bonniea]